MVPIGLESSVFKFSWAVVSIWLINTSLRDVGLCKIGLFWGMCRDSNNESLDGVEMKSQVNCVTFLRKDAMGI